MAGSIYLVGKVYPKDEKGKANLKTLEEALKLFSEAELVTLINRQLDYADIQRTAHKKYNKALTEKLSPMKQKAKELFDCTWDVLTPEEQAQVIAAVQKETKPSTLVGQLRAKIPLGRREK